MGTAESNAADATLWRTMTNTHFHVTWLSFSCDDSRLLACYVTGHTDVWDTDTGERVAILPEHGSWFHVAVFSPGNALVVTKSKSGLVHLWDLEACQEVYKDTHGTMSGYIVEEYSKSDDGNRNDDTKKTTTSPKRLSVALEGAQSFGTVAFSPDGRFLATAGWPGLIWDISSDPASNSALPPRPLMPCATLYWKHRTIQKPEKGRPPKERSADADNRKTNADDNDNNSDNDEDDDDDDYDDDDDDEGILSCPSFVFSPDSHSLFGFHSDGRLFVWTCMSRTPSSPSPLSSSSDRWEWQVAILAHGFAIPGRNSLWEYQPRRLSVSEGADGEYLLHTEIGVWVLPSTPADDKADKPGLQPSTQHRCNIVKIDTHMAILWHNQLLFKLPQMYAPYQRDAIMSYACDVHTADGDTSTIVIGTKSGHLLCFRFQGKETDVKTTEKIS